MIQPDVAADQRRLWIEMYLWACRDGGGPNQAKALANIAAQEFEARWIGVPVTKKERQDRSETNAK